MKDYAAALGRVSDDDRRFPFRTFSQVDGSVDGIHVVARDGQDVPAKGSPSFFGAVLAHDFFRRTGNLKAIAVDKDREVIKPYCGPAIAPSQTEPSSHSPSPKTT